MPEIAPKSAAGKSGVVIPNPPKWHQRLAAFLIWLGVGAVAMTIRFRLRDPHGFMSRQENFPQVIFCLWHNRLALCAQLRSVLRRRKFAKGGVAGLVSASKDGALLSAIFERFDIQPVRGSSSRRGAQALRELTTWAERGHDLAITPDGPRGPRYVVAEGAAGLAQITGLPLLPVAYFLRWKISLKSWDAFQIPLPFSVCEVVVGKTITVPREASDDEREEIRRELENELRAISKD